MLPGRAFASQLHVDGMRDDSLVRQTRDRCTRGYHVRQQLFLEILRHYDQGNSQA